MACGTVPICFDMNGPWELIQQDYNGVILPERQTRAHGPQNSSGSTLNPVASELLRDNALAVVRAEPQHGITLAFRPPISSFARRGMRTLWLARPSAGQRTRAPRQLQWLYCRFRTARGLDVRILCARECDAEVPGGFPDAPNIPKGLAKQPGAAVITFAAAPSTSWSFLQSAASSPDCFKGIWRADVAARRYHLCGNAGAAESCRLAPLAQVLSQRARADPARSISAMQRSASERIPNFPSCSARSNESGKLCSRAVR